MQDETTLEERIAVLTTTDSGKSSQGTAKELCMGKTLIQNVIRDREEIIGKYRHNDIYNMHF